MGKRTAIPPPAYSTHNAPPETGEWDVGDLWAVELTSFHMQEDGLEGCCVKPYQEYGHYLELKRLKHRKSATPLWVLKSIGNDGTLTWGPASLPIAPSTG